MAGITNKSEIDVMQFSIDRWWNTIIAYKLKIVFSYKSIINGNTAKDSINLYFINSHFVYFQVWFPGFLHVSTLMYDYWLVSSHINFFLLPACKNESCLPNVDGIGIQVIYIGTNWTTFYLLTFKTTRKKLHTFNRPSITCYNICNEYIYIYMNYYIPVNLKFWQSGSRLKHFFFL